MTLIGLLLAVVFYRSSSWMWRDGVLTCVADTLPNGLTKIWGRPGAQTHGWLQIYASELDRNMDDLRVHETVHIVQAFASSLLGLVVSLLVFVILGDPLLGLVVGGFIGGLGFVLVYGACFLFFFVRFKLGNWKMSYFHNPFEVQAYAKQDAYLDGEIKQPWGA